MQLEHKTVVLRIEITQRQYSGSAVDLRAGSRRKSRVIVRQRNADSFALIKTECTLRNIFHFNKKNTGPVMQ